MNREDQKEAPRYSAGLSHLKRFAHLRGLMSW
jgi:hypothetical protein